MPRRQAHWRSDNSLTAPRGAPGPEAILKSIVNSVIVGDESLAKSWKTVRKVTPIHMKRTWLVGLVSALALISPAVSPVGSTLAHAGPDDGKIVGTEQHIDAPKAFWEDNNFNLEILEGVDLQEGVLWVGKTEDPQYYQYTLPDEGFFDDFGAPGETYYMAPQSPFMFNYPIWWGYGADTGIPTESFRHGIGALDLLSVEGPGQVEMFFDQGRQFGPKRQLGSGDKSPHAVPIVKGTHEHSATIFTKPGRYVLEYQASARTVDGELIQSEPQDLVVQVGGQRPKDTATPSLQQRYDAADSGDAAAAGYTFSVGPAEVGKNLSTISFKAGNGANGTLTVLIDGYFLTDLDVVDGQAEWDELLGPVDSRLQAVFTPAAGEGPRWISPELSYTEGGSAQVSSAESAESWNDRTGFSWRSNWNLPTAISTPEFTVTAQHVAGRPVEAGEYANPDMVKITLQADPRLRGFIHGGFYTDPDDENPTSTIEGTIEGGKVELYGNTYDWLNGTQVRFTITPHPTIDEHATTVVLTDNYDYGKNFEGTATFETPDSAVVSPEISKPEGPDAGPDDDGAQQTILLDKGHVDILALQEDGLLVTRLKDDTGLHANQTVQRPLDQVVLVVRDNALQQRTEQLSDARFDFMGEVGQKFYYLPEAQDRGIIWPGYNTTGINYDDVDGHVTLTLTPRTVPEGATWGMFKGSGHNLEILTDSTVDDHSIEIGYPAHTHVSWAFSTPGEYVFDLTYSLTTKDGEVLTSEPEALTFAIGNAAAAQAGAEVETDPADHDKDTPSDLPLPPEEPGNGEGEDPDVIGSAQNFWNRYQPLLLVLVGFFGGVGALWSVLPLLKAFFQN